MEHNRTGRTFVPGAVVTGRTVVPGEPGLDKMLEVVASGPEPAGGQAFLLMVSGAEPGRLIALDRPEMVIGRSKYAEIRISERSMSQQHAKIVRFGDQYRIFDLRSTNGTLVNGTRIEEAELRPGDTVRTGETVFTFMGPGTTAPASSEHTLALPAGSAVRTRSPSAPGALVPTAPPPGVGGPPARRAPMSGSLATVPPQRVFEVPMPRGVAADEGPDLLAQLLRVLAFFRRYWLSILICGLLGGGAGAAYFKLVKPPARAEFELSLVPQATDNPLETQRRMNFEFFRSAQQNFIRPSLIVETLHELGVEDATEEYIRGIQRRLEFQRTGEYSYAGAFMAPTSDEAIEYLQVHLRLYLDTEVQKALKALYNEVETLERRLGETEEQLTTTEQALLAFRKENTEGLPEQGQQLYSDLIALGTERGRAASEVARTSSELRLSRQRLKSESPLIENRLEKARPYESAIADAKRDLATAKAEGKGNQHPDVVKLKAKLDGLERLRDEMLSSTGTTEDTIVRAKNPLYKDARLAADAAEAAHAIATAELSRLTNDLERTREMVAKLPELQAEYSELMRSYDVTKKSHDALFDKLNASRTQLDMERASVSARFDVITAPNVKLTPWQKILFVRVVGGLVAGFMLGIGLGLLRDLRRVIVARLAAQQRR